jgi:magnesium transporter
VEQAGDVLPELDDAFRADLLEEAAEARLTAILDELDTDDAADVLADLPDEVTLSVLPSLEDEADLRALLRYEEDTAGGLMGTELVSARPDDTVAKATEAVRQTVEDDPEAQIYVIYVVDSHKRLVGVVTLRQLLLSPANARLEDIMVRDVASVTTHVDQEEVARIMERYDFIALPVVDAAGHLVGRITIDDVVDVLREEAEEDMQRMSGVAAEEPTDSVWRVARSRLPWLFVGLAGAGASGWVIGAFEETLEKALVLSVFIPVVMAMAGNAGIQSSAIAVQGLASGDLWTSDVIRRLSKELLVSVVNGLALALALAAAVLLLPLEDAEPQALALTVSIALVIVIILSTTIGATVPLLLDRFGVDPAIATGPFITTSNDILGLAVFFLMASLLYLS